MRLSRLFVDFTAESHTASAFTSNSVMFVIYNAICGVCSLLIQGIRIGVYGVLFEYTEYHMPKLTGEELSKLYPQAKSYEELRAEREQIKEVRRPKFVALKIALWTALIVPVALTVYHTVLRLILSIEPESIDGALFGVCLAILAAVVGLAIVYYLYSLIDGVASKIFLSTTPLYFTLAIILCACGGVSSLLLSMEYSMPAVALFVILPASILSFMAVTLFKRFNT